MSLLSAIARSNEGCDLLEFAKTHKLSEDWQETREVGVKAMLTGRDLDNKNSNAKFVDGDINHEYLVHIEGPAQSCVVNLATILAMAAAYVDNELARAAKIASDSAID